MGRHHLILLGILLLAAVLRIAGVASQGLWMDEGLTLPIAQWPVKTLIFQPIDPTPGLYYLLHKALIPPDAPLLIIRSISAVSGIVAVGLIYLLGRLSFGKTTGLIAAALLAVWTPHVDYSQEARAYSLLFALTLLAAVGVMLFARDDGRRRLGLLLFAASNVLAFYTHLVAAPFIAATSLMVLILAIRRRTWREPALAFAAMAVLVVPALRRLWLQQQNGHTFDWLAQATPDIFLRHLSEVLLPWGLWANPIVAWRGDLVRHGLEIAALILLAAALWKHGRKLANGPAVALIAAFLIIPPALWAIGFFAQPVYMLRSILIAAPGFILLIAALSAQAKRPLPWAVGLVALYLASTLLYGPQRAKPDFRGADAYLAAHAGPSDIVLVCPVSNYPAVRYHADGSIAGPVIGLDYDGRLLALERSLGADPAWDRSYWRNRFNPETAPKAARPYALPAGRVIWIIHSGCREARMQPPLLAALAPTGATPKVVWRNEQRWRAPEVAVERLVVVTPAVWPVVGDF